MPENNKPPYENAPEPDKQETADPPAEGVVMIYATFPDRNTALAAGRAMVEQGVVACINVLPAMTSVYVWNGVTETADEAVMIAKLASSGAQRAVAHVLANHPYETPAVLVMPVVGGSASYIDWLQRGTAVLPPQGQLKPSG